MPYPVTYYCPHCETLVAVEREGYLADKAVTPYPLAGWSYVEPTEPFDDDTTAVDGVRFVCGDSDGVEWRPSQATQQNSDGMPKQVEPDQPDTGRSEPSQPDAERSDTDRLGCGEPFYLSFVRYEDGREVDPRPEPELVEIDPDPRPSGPGGPGEPDGSDGFW
ncbi:hypothetical protein JCM18237_06960 [Halorubrum luteum]